MRVRFKKIDEKAKTPTRGSREAAGYDLYALEDVEIRPGEKHRFNTGIAIELPMGYFASIKSRSGTSWKRDLEIVGGSGTVDSDYRGPVKVPMRNMGDEPVNVIAGNRIAQLVIQKHEVVEWEEADELNETERGEGGFGSTGYR